MISILVKILQLVNLILIVYCLMSFLIPQNRVFLTMQRFVEPVFQPIRRWLYNRFPRLASLSVDLTPLAFWLLLQIVVWILSTLVDIF